MENKPIEFQGESKPITFQGLTFKGSPDDFRLEPCSNGGKVLVMESDHRVQLINIANAQLFANSKNLLEAAIEMYNRLHAHVEQLHYELGGLDEIESGIQADKELAPFAETIKKSFT